MDVDESSVAVAIVVAMLLVVDASNGLPPVLTMGFDVFVEEIDSDLDDDDDDGGFVGLPKPFFVEAHNTVVVVGRSCCGTNVGNAPVPLV